MVCTGRGKCSRGRGPSFLQTVALDSMQFNKTMVTTNLSVSSTVGLLRKQVDGIKSARIMTMELHLEIATCSSNSACHFQIAITLCIMCLGKFPMSFASL